MKAGLWCVRGIRGLIAVALLAALAGAASWRQVVPEETEEPSEPPMVEPMSPQIPASPNPPYSLPSPTPLSPEQATPFVPAVPFAPGNPLEPPVPMVRLRVQAPGRVEPDKEIEYRLTVENVSGAPAHHVLVRDRLPHGVQEAIRTEPKFTDQKKTKDYTDLLWELGTLKPGQQQVIMLAIKPKGSEDIQNRAYVQFEHGQKVTTRIAKPSVSAKVTVAPQAMRYEEVAFRIEVANTGTAPLRNVVVTDELPAGLVFTSGKPEPKVDKLLTWKFEDVPPQQTRRIEFKAIAQEAGTFRSNAKVTASGGASATGSASVTVGEPKLKISISGPQRRLVNRPIPYHITVSNLGSVPLTNVQVSDELPPGGIEFLSASTGGRREGEFVRWSLGNLSPGELRALDLVLRSPKPGRCWDQVKVQADNNLSDKALSEMTRIEQAAGNPVIEIDKNTDWLIVGQKAIYTIRLFNPGNNGIPNPRLFVTVPDEMGIVAERGDTTGQRQGQKVQFDPVTVLGKGEEKIYTIEVVAKKAGEVTLRAWWSDGRQETSPTETWEDRTIIHDAAQPPMLTTKTQRTQSRKTKEELCTSPTALVAGH